MKKENPALYCRFMVDGRAYSGQIRGASVDIVEGDPFAGITSQIRLSYPVERVKFLPPFAPKKIWCVGRNYVGHVKELDHDIPEEPLIFLKATSAITGANDFIRIPKWAGAIHYEGELAVVIGKGGKNIPEEEVYDHVARCKTRTGSGRARKASTPSRRSAPPCCSRKSCPRPRAW